jgi:hypothetical protein
MKVTNTEATRQSEEVAGGELEGEAREPVVHADHFWFSWAVFKPDTCIYGVTSS